MKVIIAGSRSATDMAVLEDAMRRWPHKITEVVCGGARGADALGKRWAIANRIRVRMFDADWDAHGKSAGYKRNVQMADYAEGLIALWDGQSRGTKHMIDIARARRLEILVMNSALQEARRPTYGSCQTCGGARTVVSHTDGKITESDLTCMNCGGN